MVYITITDYCNLGEIAGLESGVKTLRGGTVHQFLVRLPPLWGYRVGRY